MGQFPGDVWRRWGVFYPESPPRAGGGVWGQAGWSSHTCPKFRGRGRKQQRAPPSSAGSAGPAVCDRSRSHNFLTSLNGQLHFQNARSFPGRPKWHVLHWRGAQTLDAGGLAPCWPVTVPNWMEPWLPCSCCCCCCCGSRAMSQVRGQGSWLRG